MSQKNKNVKHLLMEILPDNRPITSLQIVEDYEKCPKNFTTIHKTYDQDADADLYREKILIGRRSCRYLCISKTEGLPEYIVETLKVISEREIPPEGFSLLSRTADNEQKAWRKRQIAYKLSKRGSVKQAVTDIILCSKIKQAPEDFTQAGEINGIMVCFKIGPVTHRAPPQVPPIGDKTIQSIDNLMHYVNVSSPLTKGLYPLPKKAPKIDDDYEEIQSTYQVKPLRPAPNKPPAAAADSLHRQLSHTGTLGIHTYLDGISFQLNPMLSQATVHDIPQPNIFEECLKRNKSVEYDFHLEREVLCTTKSENLKNPFFH